MFDLKFIRANQELFKAHLIKCNCNTNLLFHDETIRELKQKLNILEEKKNLIAKEIPILKKHNSPIQHLIDEGILLRQKIDETSIHIRDYEKYFTSELSRIPNIPDESVPHGKDENDNIIIREKNYCYKSFPSKQHFELLDIDFDNAVKISGSRFSILKGDLALLERALGQFMLDQHVLCHGYTEISGPLLVNEKAMFGTGQLPKFKEDLFQTTDGKYLIPTSEVSLTNIVADQILDANELPLRFVSLTPCFRSEAGSSGKDIKGIFRQHQFWKVELVSIVEPDMSSNEHDRLTRCAETILDLLDLPYRKVLLCSGDTGFASSKTYDLEVWLEGLKQYREISSCSNMKSFQAVRMNTKYKKNGKNDFVHTLNGSGLAVGRTLIAIMENYQNEDGSITIPSVLIKYMHGKTKIS